MNRRAFLHLFSGCCRSWGAAGLGGRGQWCPFSACTPAWGDASSQQEARDRDILLTSILPLQSTGLRSYPGRRRYKTGAPRHLDGAHTIESPPRLGSITTDSCAGQTGSSRAVCSSPVAALTSYHEHSGFKQHKCIIVQFWRSEVYDVSTELPSFWRFQGRIHFLALSASKATSMPWLTSSSATASSVGSSLLSDPALSWLPLHLCSSCNSPASLWGWD